MGNRRVICEAEESDSNARGNGSNCDDEGDNDYTRHHCGNDQPQLYPACAHAAILCDKAGQRQGFSPKKQLT